MCSGIVQLYFKFWRGEKSLASLRRVYNTVCIVQVLMPGLQCIGRSIHQYRQGKGVEGAGRGQIAETSCR